MLKRHIIIVSLLLVSTVMSATDYQPVQDIITRRFEKLKGKVSFVDIPNAKNDTAVYRSLNGKLTISAGSVNAAAYALYDYVKNYCNSSLSHTGDNVNIPGRLPTTDGERHVSAKYPLRYALNYCTYNYTMAFWKWEDWERELDWMSLNGVNIMLTPMGTEQVWQMTLKQLGYSDKDIRSFIPGPAFNAWWLMGNLEGWGGPVSDKIINHWTNLQKKILARMKELNIQPVIQGFTGLVPSTFNKYFPKAKVIQQGNWCGFQRPAVLLANDVLFKKVSDLYYNNFAKLYGKDFKYLGGDLFHEGGSTAGVDVSANAKAIQQDMLAHFDNAIWVLQGWGSNPKKEILNGLNPKNTLIIDLQGDQYETWHHRNQYGNFPWIWSTITNFGGKTTTGGYLLRVLNEPKRAQTIFRDKSTLQGVGIIPEGIENNSIVYQWALDGAWRDTLSIQMRLDNFINARYGDNNPMLNEAWQYLLQTVYGGTDPTLSEGQGGYESIFCARPDTNYIYTTSCCGPTKLLYDADLLAEVAHNFAKVSEKYKDKETFQYDYIDVQRQVINLKARKVYADMMQSYRKRDKTAFIESKDKFIKLLKQQNDLLANNKYFRLDRWLNQSKTMMGNADDAKLCEWNARTQITYWGPDDPHGYLHEYANKEWNGLLIELYLPRWQAFFDYIEAKIDGKQVDYPNFFKMEKAWGEQSIQ